MRELPRAGRLIGFGWADFLGPAHLCPYLGGAIVVIALRRAIGQLSGVSELVVGEGEEVFDGLFMKFPAFAAPAQTWI